LPQQGKAINRLYKLIYQIWLIRNRIGEFCLESLLTWLYKSLYGLFLLCGKLYGTIRQCPMAKGIGPYTKNTTLRSIPPGLRRLGTNLAMLVKEVELLWTTPDQIWIRHC